MLGEHDLMTTIKGLEGCRSDYSLSEFEHYLKVNLSSKKLQSGWVFWRSEEERDQQYSEYEELVYHDFNSNCHQKVIKDKLISVLVATASDRKRGFWLDSLIQFWAAKVEGQHQYLTTSDQPFFVQCLRKGFCWYRELCMNQNCFVEGANEELVGPIGRAYRNKRPESSPDLRLYSTKEFPLRDYAARCGLREYLALPVFDLLNNECYGVLEVLSFDSWITYRLPSLDRALQVGGLRCTHTNFIPISYRNSEMCLNFGPLICPTQPPKYNEQPESEISRMLELAIKAMPELHLAQVWVPCKQCANMSNNLSCLERATFITADSETVNTCYYIDQDMFEYLQASEFHNLQIGKGITKAIMSSDSKSCFCRNLCDLSISENPLAHYAQKVRLSVCLAFSLETVYNRKELYLIEFFLRSNCGGEAFADSFQHLILRIMEMELKSYKLALGGQLGVPANAIQYESTQYAQGMKHQHSEELNMFTLMEGYSKSYSESNFQKYLQTAVWCSLLPSKKNGWVFRSPCREELIENDVNSTSYFVPDAIKMKIGLSMKKMASKWTRPYWLMQFWAPKMEGDGCYLKTSDQPYALGCLKKGLAFFRKQCMENRYSVDEGAKEEELGPPGRVFRSGHPEITPDLRLYSTREFPLRNHAAQCHLRKYSALPVFDLERYKCVGVLELVESSDVIARVESSDVIARVESSYVIAHEDIEKDLEAAHLSLTHCKFKPSFRTSDLRFNDIAKRRKLALTEIKEALHLMRDIPQLYKAEVRVPYDDNNFSCMGLALSTVNIEFNLRRYEVHVQTGKGIAAMVLASENKSCFCRNSFDFSITEQPLAHYRQRERVDVCFAICLQSSHTGNLPYVLEFFLNQGPSKYDYLLSFLNFLLPLMKQKLKSFKVASGKQLGEELVVEVIEFSEASELNFSEVNQLDICPVKFKIVQYGRKEHQHTKDQQVHCGSDGMDPVRSSAQAKECGTAANNSKTEDAAKRKGKEKGKGKTSLRLNLEDLKPHFGTKLVDVAEELGVGRSTIKRVLRDHNIPRWPNNKKYRKNPSLFMIESANEIVLDSQQNMQPSSSSNVRLLEMPHHQNQNVPQTNMESHQHLTPQAEAEVIIKVKYEDNIIKFQLCVSSGMGKLVEEVAARLNLEKRSFRLKYLDEDNDEILLACDADLQLCLKSMTVTGKSYIQLFVRLVHH